ncbi:sulfite exporter TauE/SafE family protein [Aliiruegeria lutimaris]|uniref:Probable membrane transporter protein n=1 Tax=Aliiruegeria lutimaris TaxID=571298 RepID=A0A1G8IFB4_9RHOB|nr:sulfite exporter TauE/SafE family protein [Aliiruegeria lutimaris]SDI17606.1 hypothetical protein SAMN04488026_100121 [Aliiruegeria lutimaris]
MPEALAEALATPGLGWLCGIIFIAGCVRGFAGFGAALVFVPLAALFIPPVWVIVVIMTADIIGAMTLAPRALRDAGLRDVSALTLGCTICLPFGIMVLERMDPEAFRWVVALVALAMVALLASGWRHHVTFSRTALAGIGGASGFLGGFTGQPGPPVILAYLGGEYAAARIRANTLLFLLAFDILLVAALHFRGLLEIHAVVLGLILMIPSTLGNMLGAQLFDPARARMYRFLAHGLIAASALLALPIFG